MRFCPRSQPFGRDGLERGGAKVVKREREEDLSPPLFIYPLFFAPPGFLWGTHLFYV
jgi:hypothetical protein